MFDDYKREVRKAFDDKKAAGDLSLNLTEPTRKSLKQECLLVLNARFRKTDLETLRLFFGTKEDQKAYETAIKISSAEDFRTLHNYINGDTERPDNKIVELLSWLIDFEPRPYRKFDLLFEKRPLSRPPNAGPENWLPSFAGSPDDRQIPEPSDTETILFENNNNRNAAEQQSLNFVSPKEGGSSITIDEASPDDPAGKGVIADVKNKNKKQGSSRKAHLVIISLLLLTFIGAGLYYLFFWKKCMIWKEDHYERVSCEQYSAGALVIPIDLVKLAYFRKIKQPNRLTRWSVGKVFYFKVDKDSAEFFTMDSDYPLDTTRRLKPMSKYIWEKYALRKAPKKKADEDQSE